MKTSDRLATILFLLAAPAARFLELKNNYDPAGLPTGGFPYLPAVLAAGLIFGAMLEVFAASLLHTENWSGIASLGSVINVPAIIIFLVLSLGIWKLKKLHPIVFILIGAVCGIVFNL